MLQSTSLKKKLREATLCKQAVVVVFFSRFGAQAGIRNIFLISPHSNETCLCMGWETSRVEKKKKKKKKKTRNYSVTNLALNGES